METRLKSPGEAIKYHRRNIFMKQTKLAELLNCNPNEITNYEADNVLPYHKNPLIFPSLKFMKKPICSIFFQ